MNKEMFLILLRDKLHYLPQEDIEERLAFYEEMIDDRIEEGMTEEEATAAVGSIDEIANQIISEIPLTKIVSEKIKPKEKPQIWMIVLLILGSPVWLPLLIAAIAVIFSIYVAIWSVVLSLYAVDLALGVSCIAALPAAFVFFISGNPFGGIFMIGAGLALAGLTILMFYACILISKGLIKLTAAFFLWIKHLIIKKNEPAAANSV